MNLAERTLLIEGESDEEDTYSEIYLRGSMTDEFGVDEAWKFSTEDGNVYTLAHVSVAAEDIFKIGGATWGKINYGGEGEPYALNESYTLVSNSNFNMALEEGCSDVTFTFTLSDASLKIEGVADGFVRDEEGGDEGEGDEGEGGDQTDGYTYLLWGNFEGGASWRASILEDNEGMWISKAVEAQECNFGIKKVNAEGEQVEWIWQ